MGYLQWSMGCLEPFLRKQTIRKNVLNKLLIYLNDKGVLKNSYVWEVKDAVYESLNNICNELSEIMNELDGTSPFRQHIEIIQEMSRVYIQNPKIFP